MHDLRPHRARRDQERGDRPSGKRTTEPRYLDRGQLDLLLSRLAPEYRAVASSLDLRGSPGLRVSEALSLRWADVDLDAGTLRVRGTKTAASAASVPMAAQLVTELRCHRQRLAERGLQHMTADAPVFTPARRNVLRTIWRAGDLAGLNPEGVERIGCHDLRHSCAGLLFAAGQAAPEVASMLRHADSRVTLTVYAGIVETDREERLREGLVAAFG